MEILSDHTSFSREAREEAEDTGAGNLFLWSVAIVVLLGLNAFSWIFCMYVFGNPEQPFCYRLLTKLDKLDPVGGFSPVTAPRGRFHGPKDLYTEVYALTEDQLEPYNAILKRLYLYNYRERDDVKFISGTFFVESVRRLEAADIFPSGLAIRARAEDFPAAYVDLVLPSDNPPDKHFKPGDVLEIEESATCAAVLNAAKLEEDRICFTAVPLVERKIETPAGEIISVKPPEKLNLGTGRWPLSDAGIDLAEEPAPGKAGEAETKADGDAENAVEDSGQEKAKEKP
ncbi:MAG: hypothetical protein KDM91_10640 [Verrucomicrobiae bacterium]|nr:hypothetical protein [Verrucomicrobiae bacterium]